MGKGTDQVEFAHRLGKRPAPELVGVGDTVECDLIERLVVLTPEAAAFANELLSLPESGWRKTPNAELSGERSESD